MNESSAFLLETVIFLIIHNINNKIENIIKNIDLFYFFNVLHQNVH